MRDFLERWWYGREPILGIDIRDNGIVVADVDLRGKNQWHSSEALSTDSGAGGLLRDTRAFSSFLGDFISLSRTTLERCAVGFPASLTSISCLVLPHEVVERSEKVRYEAALERAHLRPQDVRGRVYSIRGGSAGGPNTLLVAAKAADVALLEDGVALAGLEISCLTPRVFALHHLVSLAGLVRNGERIVYSERSSRSSVLHLFKGSHYHSTICESGDLWKEIEDCTEGDDESNGSGTVKFVGDDDDRNVALICQRCAAARFISIGELRLPGGRELDYEQVAAAALSLSEARPRL